MKSVVADAAAVTPMNKTQDKRKDDRPLPPREFDKFLKQPTSSQSVDHSSKLVGMNGPSRRSSFPPSESVAIDGESGYYYPTGYVHPNTKPLKSCLSNSNLSAMSPSGSMTRRGSAPNLSSMGNMTRNVSFHKVEIREYERAVGDHPCATGGISLSLGWSYDPDHAVVDFEPYEESRLERSTGAGPLPVSGVEKRSILMEETNATQDELQKARLKILVLRGQRRRTNAMQDHPLEKIEEGFQSAKRKIKRVLSGTSKAKEEKKLWKNAEKAAKERAAIIKPRPTEGQSHQSSVKIDIDNSSKRRASLSSDTSLSNSIESEPGNSPNSETLHLSLADTEISSDNDWEFSYG